MHVQYPGKLEMVHNSGVWHVRVVVAAAAVEISLELDMEISL